MAVGIAFRAALAGVVLLVEKAVQQLGTAWTNALDALNCSSSS
jgi:hypothetical protein